MNGDELIMAAIRQSTISAIAICIFSLIILMMFISSYVMKQNVIQERGALSEQTEMLQIGYDMASASDYLTDEARSFSVNRNVQNLRNYWYEINVSKTRDNAINRLEKIQNADEEQIILAKAKQQSDQLLKTEARSMRLIIDAMNLPISQMPTGISVYELSAADKQLTSSEKIVLARKIMFDDQYEAAKGLVNSYVARYEEMIAQRSQAKLKELNRANKIAANLQVALFVIIVAVVLIYIGVFHTQNSRPIKNYVAALGSKAFYTLYSQIKPEGTRELRALGETLNERQFEIKLIFNLYKLLAETDDLQSLLDKSAKMLRESMNIDGIQIFLTENDEWLQVKASYGVPEQLKEEIKSLKIGDGVAGKAVAAGIDTHVLLTDYPEGAIKDASVAAGFVAVHCYPMSVGGYH